MALTTDGRVLAWGWNTAGQRDVPALQDVVQLAAGWEHSLALTAHGRVVVWGRNDEGQCDVPVGMLDVLQVSTDVRTH